MNFITIIALFPVFYSCEGQTFDLSDLSTEYTLTSKNFINAVKPVIQNFTISDSFYTDIYLNPDPTCIFVSSEYFTQPICPHTHCGTSFPVAYTSGYFFKKAVLCLPTIQYSHYVYYKYTPKIPLLFTVYVDLYNYFSGTYENQTKVVVSATLTKDTFIYCNSAKKCLVLSEFCVDSAFRGREPPVILAYKSEIGEVFTYTLPDTSCPKPTYVDLNDLIYSLPITYDTLPNLSLFYLKGKNRPPSKLYPHSLGLSFSCVNISLCPKLISHKINLLEHSVHVEHMSFGASLAHSLFHLIFALFNFIFGIISKGLVSVIGSCGIVNFFDAFFVFIIMKFFLCTSNSIIVSSVFLFFRILI